ncbi:MAG: site-specific DNA-methyltransferase [Bacteroides sp.]|nr:site-specific DNA-methyltransferase [Bacteroides sp.]
MAQNKINKLELTWIGKEDEPLAVEPRLLLDSPEYSFGEVETGTLPNGKPWPGNMLIHGDNLLALRALEQDFAGQIKCVYIDPPYNIGAAVEDYDDNIENSLWLSLMYSRLNIIYNLLSKDGLLAVQIDDTNFARLYLVLSEIFGERNVKSICVKMSEATGVKMASVNKAGSIAKIKEFIILAKKDGIKNLFLERIPKDSWDDEYKTYISGISDEDLESVKLILSDENRTQEDIEFVDRVFENVTFSNINSVALEETGANATDDWKYSHANRIVQFATLTGGARDLAISKKSTYDTVPSAFGITTKHGKMYLIKGEFNTATKLSRCKILFADQYLTINPGDLWLDIKTTGLDNEGVVAFKNSKKPEKLIKRIILMNTTEKDIVLDSFLGSGTTAAVAHKMGRRWIGVELGEHAYTHSAVRMKKVIEGEQGGISKSVNWKGGGGFKFYELAPSLLNKDKYGNLVINKEYNADMLAAAMAKHQGFTYSPDEEIYWKQGKSSEHDYIFTTTQLITAEMLETIHEQLGENESLLICCTKFQPECRNRFSNITIKKIPKVLLDTCEFDRDDYSLNIVSLPDIDDKEWDDAGAGGEAFECDNSLKAYDKLLFD